MKRKYLICLITLIFIIAVSISSVSAEDSDISNVTAVSDEIDVDMDESVDRTINDVSNFQTVDSGNVSGGVDIADDNSFATSSSFTYDVPSNATIKKAYLHANVYSGSAQPTYAANAKIYMNGNLFKDENLIFYTGSTDGTVYVINENITKVYSDYDMRYDITDTISGLNGTTLNFEMNTTAINGYSFDGRIKWFALVVAYDDGDDDVIYYWIKSGQAWFNQPATTTFETSSISNPKNANLRNVILSSSNPEFTLNGNSTVADTIFYGSYYNYNEWNDISNYMPGSSNTFLGWIPGNGYYGYSSMKTVLGVLTLEEEQILANKFNDLLGSCDLSDVLSVSSEENLAEINNIPNGGVFTYDWSYNTTVNGDIDIYVITNNQINLKNGYNTEITITLDKDETISESYLFIPVTYYAQKDAGKFGNITIGGIQCELLHAYLYSNPTTGLLIYNITGLIAANNKTMLSVKYPASSSMNGMGPYIITLYQKANALQKNVYFGNGANYLKPSGGPYNVTNEVNISMVDNFIEATYYLITGTSINGVINVEFNNNSYVAFPDNIGTNNQGTHYFSTDVTEIIKESNNITIKAVDVGIAPLNAASIFNQLIVETSGELNVDVTDIKTEYDYKNQYTAYAGTNNVITTIIDYAIPYGSDNNWAVKLWADGVVVNEKVVELPYYGSKTISLIDPTIRPIDEFTVNAANVTNKKVVYTVEIYNGDKLFSTKNITVPILYNGYLNKDYAYPTGDEPYTFNTTVSGGILIEIAGEYAGTGVNNRTDKFTLTLPENSTFVNGLLYVTYTSDKTPAGFPVFNMTFNNVDISDRIVGKYRDKTNLGSYGASWYGVIIYDVSGLINDGNNNLVLIKANGTIVAVYPTVLIGLYNTTGSTVLSDIYILNGADQLSSGNYNKAGRLVNVTNNVELDISKMQNAYWYVFESGGTSERGDLVFNDNEYYNVWTGTNYNAVQYYFADVSDLIKDSNIVSFVSTGSGITALQQIIVVENALFDLNVPAEITTGETSGFTMDLPSDATGYVLLEVDGNKLFSEVTNGTATFNIPSLTAGDNIVKCTYLGDNKYRAMTSNSIIHVLVQPVDPALTISIANIDEESSAVVIITTNATFTGNVTVQIGAKNYTVSVINGAGNVSIAGLAAGDYTAKAIFAATDVFKASEKSTVFTVNKKVIPPTPKQTIKLTLKKVKVKKSAKKLVITATLKINGKNTKGKKLKFKFNKKTYTAKTNKKGVAKITIKKNVLKKLKVGKKVTYQVSYGGKTVKNSVKVKK